MFRIVDHEGRHGLHALVGDGRMPAGPAALGRAGQDETVNPQRRQFAFGQAHGARDGRGHRNMQRQGLALRRRFHKQRPGVRNAVVFAACGAVGEVAQHDHHGARALRQGRDRLGGQFTGWLRRATIDGLARAVAGDQQRTRGQGIGRHIERNVVLPAGRLDQVFRRPVLRGQQIVAAFDSDHGAGGSTPVAQRLRLYRIVVTHQRLAKANCGIGGAALRCGRCTGRPCSEQGEE